MTILDTRSHVIFSSSSGAHPGAACHVQRSGDLRTVYSYCRVGIKGRRTMTTNDRTGHGNAWFALRNRSCESRATKILAVPDHHDSGVVGCQWQRTVVQRAIPIVFLGALACTSAVALPLKEEADRLVDGRQYKEAVEMYDRALQEEPGRLGAIWGRAAARMGLTEYDLAVADYTTLLQLDEGPSSPLLYFERARAEAAAEHWSEAAVDYGLAADGFLQQKDRRSYGAAQGLHGVTAFESGDVVRAERILEGLARARYNSDVRLALVALHWSKGEVEQAEDLWQSTCQIEKSQCSRYRDSDWLRAERGWPPHLISSMQDFRSMK